MMNFDSGRRFINSLSDKSFRDINNFNILFVIFIIYGVVCKLLIALSLSLNSDTVDAGIVSLEIWKNENYLLESYYFPSANPYWFSDIFTFHLIPQIISDFDPSCIRIVSYVIFLLIIFIFSIYIYKVSHDKTATLIFAALVANIYPGSALFYLSSTSHNATIVFVGLFLLLFLNNDYKFNLQNMFYICAINLILFSDSLVLVWFIVPSIFNYILLYKDEYLRSNAFVIFAISTFIFTYIYKSNFVENFITIAIQVKDIRTILELNLPLYFKGMSTLLFGTADGTISSNYFGILFLIVAIYYGFHKLYNNYKYILVFSAVSALIIFVGYISTSLCVNIATTRYLTFTAISVYCIAALAYRKGDTVYMLLVLIVLSLCAVSNYMFIDQLDYQPNADELNIINYLANNGLNYGYADYWDSNIITYLSKGKIEILPILLYPESNKPGSSHISVYYLQGFRPFRFTTCERWYTNRLNFSDDYFILINQRETSEPLIKKYAVEEFIKYVIPKNKLRFGSYTIYVFDGPAPMQTSNNGWYDIENWAGNSTRWIGSSAILLANSDQNYSATLSLKATSFYHNRTLEIHSANELLARAAIPSVGFYEIRVPVRLVNGTNVFRFSVPEGCERPCDSPELSNLDSRCLSVAIQNITLCERQITSLNYLTGFHDIENWSSTPFRWMQANATLLVYSSEVRAAKMSLNAYGFYRNRTLEIFCNGVSAVRVAVPTSFIDISVPIRLAKGVNTVRLHVPEGCERPSDLSVLNSVDSRCMSVAVQNFTVT
jgi:hypothetical protein